MGELSESLMHGIGVYSVKVDRNGPGSERYANIKKKKKINKK
jgi:hypothetical protein